jgi:hypothetical protein
MNTTDILAVVAIVLSALSAAFTCWQALLAKKANEHAADSAESARLSVEVAKNQDRRDAERDLREQTGWIIRKTGITDVYELQNVSGTTAYFLPNEKYNAIQLFKRENNLMPGESSMFTVKSVDGETPKKVTLVWNDGDQFRERVVNLPAA